MKFRHRLRQAMNEKFNMFYFRFHILGLKKTLKTEGRYVNAKPRWHVKRTLMTWNCNLSLGFQGHSRSSSNIGVILLKQTSQKQNLMQVFDPGLAEPRPKNTISTKISFRKRIMNAHIFFTLRPLLFLFFSEDFLMENTVRLSKKSNRLIFWGATRKNFPKKFLFRGQNWPLFLIKGVIKGVLYYQNFQIVYL